MRRLPVLAEKAVADVKALQIQGGQQFRMQMFQDEIVPTCRKGCAACCKHPFLISIAEGVLLYRWLRQNGRWSAALRTRCEETRGKVLGAAFEIWLLSDIPCPLLVSNNECLAYEARPMRCRVTWSSGLPQMCEPARLDAQTPLVNNAEAIVQFSQASLAALKRAGLSEAHLMPVAEALLIAEALDTGKLQFIESNQQHVRDLVNVG